VTSETASVPVPLPRGWVVGYAATKHGQDEKSGLARDRRRVSGSAHTVPLIIYRDSGIGLMSQIDLGAMTELRVNFQDFICPVPAEALLKWCRFGQEIIENTPFGEYVLSLPVIRWTSSPIKVETGKVQPLSSNVTLNVTELELADPAPLVQRLSLVFEMAFAEEFEDGTDSNFSRTLDSFIQIYGNAAISALEKILHSGQTNAEVAGEALRWIGKVQHEESRRYRLTVLQKNLKSSSVRLRYATAVGLAAMDDPNAIPFLTEAIENERHDKMRSHLQLVLKQLQQTRQCHNY
jgi:hypothetical protein